jgi:hypothetical protein
MRPVIEDFMRSSERVIGFMHRNGGLDHEECQAVLLYIAELEREVVPRCERDHEDKKNSPVSTVGF